MEELNLEDIYKHSKSNKKEISKSDTCGCFYCREIFAPSEIKNWIKDKEIETAQCPYCWVDSVIGNGGGFQITKNLLEKLNQKYFKKN